MSQIDLSVIIPVYNIEKYIAECIESVISQSTTYVCYEVILVDDGSIDSSGKICDEYSKEHNNIKVIHQKNRGVSIARNEGIKVATGNYISFLDGDDFWDNSAIDKLGKIISQQPDVGVLAGQRFINGKKCGEICSKIMPNGEDGREYLKRIMKKGADFLSYPWLYVYKTDFLRINNLFFTPGRITCEDFEFNLKCFDKAKRMIGLPEVIVNYRTRNDSLTALLTYSKLLDNLQLKADAFRKYNYCGFADMYLWTVLQISRLSKKTDIEKIKKYLIPNKDIEKKVKKKSLKFGKLLISICGYEMGSRIYLILSGFMNKRIFGCNKHQAPWSKNNGHNQ